MTLREIDIEQQYHVHEHGHETWTDVHIPERVDTVSADLAEYVWHEFGIDLDDDEFDVEVDDGS
jgi:hypothetical protein